MSRSRPGILVLPLVFAGLAFAGSVRAADGTFDLLLDLDMDPTTGCDTTSAGAPVAGVELRLRSLVDLATDQVTSVAAAACSDAGTGQFAAEVPIGGPPAPPWSAVPGAGASGSTLIETLLPLSLAAEATGADLYASFQAAAGSDALHTTDGTPAGPTIRVELRPGELPALSSAALAGLAALLAATAAVWLARSRPGPAVLALLCSASLVAPLAGRASHGAGSLRAWLGGEIVAADVPGDAPEGADILGLHVAWDAALLALLVRLDVRLGPPVCLEWGTVDPGSGFPCLMNPPPDAGPFGQHVALTFDDGPDLVTTPQILATLRAENVPATFFPVGRKLETAPEQALLREIHDDPLFAVANHSYTHPNFDQLSSEEAIAEIDDTSNQIRIALGDPCFAPRYFRFPRGRSTCTEVALVRERGMAVTGVHLDTRDWCFGAGGGTCPPEVFPGIPAEFRSDMLGFILHQLAITGGGIVLMHDVQAYTAQQLPAIIGALRAAGATFVRLDDTAWFPLLNAEVNPPEPPACCEGMVN